MKVSNVDIYGSEWLNVVFAGRNQAYGAYELRKHNARNTNRAMLIALGSFLLVMAVPTIINKLRHSATEIDKGIVYKKTEFDQRVYKIEQPKAEKQHGHQTAKPSTDVVRDQPFVVTNDAKTDPPTQTVLQIADPGPATISGTHTGEPAPVGTLPGPGNIAGIASGAEADGNGNEVVAIAEFAPEYPGGEMAFNRFLQKNIRYPQMAKETGIQGKAYLQFVVERDGSLTDIKIVRNPGAGTGEEAERVLKMSPHWKPGIQNGKAVRFQYTVPVNFSLGDQN